MKTLLACCALATLYIAVFNSIPLLAAEPDKVAGNPALPHTVWQQGYLATQQQQ